MAEIKVDLFKAIKVSKKVMDLLSRRTKSPLEGYLACKILTIYFENTMGVKMNASEEKELTEYAKNMAYELKDM